VAIAFEDGAHAHAALGDIRALVARKQLRLEDACIVTRRDDGSLSVTETVELSGSGGAVRGGIAGGLAGAIVLLPVVGLVVGAALGAFLASRRDFGVSSDFQRRLGEVLQPGRAALAALVEAGDVEAITAVVSQWHAEIVTTDLDPEIEEQLRDALNQPDS
jgi:uncharacterized membrane protein